MATVPEKTSLENTLKYCFLSKYEKEYGTVFLKDCINKEISSELTFNSVNILVNTRISSEDIANYRAGLL